METDVNRSVYVGNERRSFPASECMRGQTAGEVALIVFLTLQFRESSLSPTVVLICRSTAYVWLTRMAAGRNSPVRGEAGKQTVVEQEIIPMLEALFSTSPFGAIYSAPVLPFGLLHPTQRRHVILDGLSFDNSREEISRAYLVYIRI
ncbi:hypothetical protein KCU99_g372, partial [Aureobasidium melanogenum]